MGDVAWSELMSVLFCHDGLHISSRRAHLVLDGELGKRELIRHDDMCLCWFNEKWYVGGMRCDDHFSEMV